MLYCIFSGLKNVFVNHSE